MKTKQERRRMEEYSWKQLIKDIRNNKMTKRDGYFMEAGAYQGWIIALIIYLLFWKLIPMLVLKIYNGI